MNTEIKEGVYSHDFHSGTVVPQHTIREWHSKVFNAINTGKSRCSIQSGNSMVFGYRTAFENSIEIIEVINGYYQYIYPQPSVSQVLSEEKKHLQFIYDRLKEVHGEKENVDYMIKLRELILSIDL